MSGARAAALLALLVAGPAVALRRAEPTVDDGSEEEGREAWGEGLIPTEPNCKCLPWSRVYAEMGVRCGAVHEKRTLENCDKFYQRIDSPMCFNVDRDSQDTRQWCYVSDKCEALGDGKNIKKTQVAWKTCKSKRDELTQEWPVRRILMLARRLDLEITEIMSMSYQKFHGPHWEDISETLLQGNSFNLTGVAEPFKSRLEDIMMYGHPTVIQSGNRKPPFGLLTGYKLYVMANNDEWAYKQPWEVKWTHPGKITTISMAKEA